MKKVVGIVLAGVMLWGASACAREALQASTAGAIAPEQIEEPPAAAEIERVCSQADAEDMLRACGQLAAYLSISVYEIDMSRPDPEDFWLMLSLVTYSAYPDFLSEFGTIDLTRDEVLDIAQTFFPEYMAENDLPDVQDSYVAEYVAAEALYEFQPMKISDVEYELVSIDPTGNGDGSFLMGIRLKDAQDRTEKLEWLVSLRMWDDHNEHIFPCRFQHIWCGTNSAE
ncbi:MAG: hypothetical protein PHH65_05375 [Eubacteriales bacterium]|nr:hypothetical protein [Eubacteriales bacterium]